MSKNHLYILMLLFCLSHTVCANIIYRPKAIPTHIEVRFESKTVYNIQKFMYFWYTDMYTKEECRIASVVNNYNTSTLDFKLYHPLYDELNFGTRKIPFYVEPGDSLIIYINDGGRVDRYKKADGSPVK